MMIFEEKDVPDCLGGHYGLDNVHLPLLFSNKIFIVSMNTLYHVFMNT